MVIFCCEIDFFYIVVVIPNLVHDLETVCSLR